MRRFFDYNFDRLNLDFETDVFGPALTSSLAAFTLSDLLAAPPADIPLFADIDGTAGDDLLDGTANADTINGFAGNDVINGLAGNDILIGGDGDDIINAGEGDDIIILGGIGEDTIDGGEGFDLVSYEFSTTGTIVFFSFSTGTPTLRVYSIDNGLHRHSLTNVEIFEQRDSTTNDLQVLGRHLTAGDDVLDLSAEGILGSAVIYGDDGNDIVTAGSAYDGTVGALSSTPYANALYGGSGDDTLTGSNYRDFISGGAGADTLDGGSGDTDVLTYFHSMAGVTVNLTTNTASGGHATGDIISNFEQILGSQFDDILTGDVKDNRLTGNGGDDILSGGEGNDEIVTRTGSNILSGGDGDDIFRMQDIQSIFNNTITDIQSGDVIVLAKISSVVTIPTFIDDAAFNGVENEVRYYLSGGETIIEIDGDGDAIADSYITLSSGEFELTASLTPADWLELSATPINNPNIINGTSGDDSLIGTIGNDVINGFEGSDEISGGGGDDIIDAGAGNDFVAAGNGDDFVTAGSGNDTLDGDDGQDTAIFLSNQSDFRVVFSELVGTIVHDLSGNGGFNTLREFETAQFSDGNLTIDYDLIGIIGQNFSEDTLIGTIASEYLSGRELNDFIDGGAGNDTIYGGRGDDILSGGDGDDNIAIGIGADFIDGGNGLDYVLTEGQNDLRINALSDGTLVHNTFNYTPWGIDFLTNIEGFYISNPGFQSAEIVPYFTLGTTGISIGDDNFTGTGQRDIINGVAGNDVLTGGGSQDWLFGGDGDDILIGGEGNDIIDGGLGSDTAIFTGVLADYIVTDVGGDGDSWFITDQVGSEGTDSLINVQFAQFADQTINLSSVEFTQNDLAGDGADVLEGSSGDDILNGLGGWDILIGNGGDDTLIGGEGVDFLFGGDGIDIAVFGGNLADYNFRLWDGGVWYVEGPETSELRSVEFVRFDDGDVALTTALLFTEGDDNVFGTTDDDIFDARGGNDYVDGQVGNDQISGGDGNDTIVGGAGDDILDGGDGEDLAIFFGNILDFNIVNNGDGTYTVTDNVNGNGVDTLANIETVQFGDGVIDLSTISPSSEINGTLSNDSLMGTAADDVINGLAGNDILEGLAGNDVLNGGDGADSLIGGEGADALNGGAGFDSADYRGANSGVRFNVDTGGTLGEALGDTFSGIERYYLSDFNDIITGSSANEFFFGEDGNDQINGGGGIDRIYGGDGNDIQRGQDGNDTLYGSSGADQLNGGAGFDIANYSLAAAGVIVNMLTGGTSGDAAGDTYFGIEAVYGSDFDDSLTGNNSANELRGGDGNDALFGLGGNDRFFGGEGADSFDGGTGTDIVNYTLATSGITLDLTSGGTAGEAAGDNFTSVEWVFGSDFNDNITGDAANNRLEGRDGNDTLNGEGGNDRLLGGDGNDTINGGDGVDTIFGQAGDDMLNGGAGNDFFFGGQGNDDHDGGTGTDTVSYLASSIGLTIDMMGITSTGDAQGDSFISIERIFGSGFDDIIIAGPDSMILLGNGGNDYLQGDMGNDSLNGGAGLDSFGYDTTFGGADVIQGFATNELIYITNANFNSDFDTWAEVQAVGSDVGGNVIFDFGFGATLTIVGRSLAELDASNFDFSGMPPAAEPLSDPDAFAADIVDTFDMDALI